MSRRIIPACVAVGVALVGMFLVIGGMAQAADPPILTLEEPLSSTAEQTRQSMTPTLSLRLVGSDGELLSSPPVYRVLVSDEGGWQSTELGVHNLGSEELAIAAGPLTMTSDTGEFVPATLGLLPVSQTVKANQVVTSTLSLTEGWLPAGKYSASLQFSAEGIEPVTEPFVLLVSLWEAELEWAQKEFDYVVDERHIQATVWAMARHADAQGVKAELTTLTARGGVNHPFGTKDFLISTEPVLLTKDKVTGLTLEFTADKLPEPGTYEGALRLSASNAELITETLTLVVPEERARGSYQIAYAELGRTPVLSPTLPVTMERVLQFTGVRWLPASTSVVQRGPILAGGLLLGIALAVLVEYAGWAHFGSAPKSPDEGADTQGVAAYLGHRLLRHWFAVLVGVAAFLLVVVLSCLPGLLRRPGLTTPDPTQAHVGPRTLLIWETEGRGPVRDITVQGEEVASEIGYTGRISVGEHAGKIEVGDALTVPIDIEALSHPGAYVGYILIQSPDIKEGVKKVPVQVTVHDSMLWPALVIMLGVILGGYVKYQQEIASERLEKRRGIEEAWQQWDDHMSSDGYLYPVTGDRAGQINPMYEEVRHELDRVDKLLNVNPEWGIESAENSVKAVEGKLKTYQRLSEAVTSWSEDLASETGGSRSESAIDKAREWIESAKSALRRGDLSGATILVGKLIRDVLPGGIRGLTNLVDEKVTDENGKKKIKALLDQADSLSKQGIHGGAWLKFKEAEHQLRQLGVVVPLFVLLWKPPKEPAREEIREVKAAEEEVERVKEEPRYRIQLLTVSTRYRVGDTIELKVVQMGESGEDKELPDGVTCEWSTGYPSGTASGDAKFDPKDGISTTATFYKVGYWTVWATITAEGEANTVELTPPLAITVEHRYGIQRRLVGDLYRGDTVELEVVERCSDGKQKPPSGEVGCQWGVTSNADGAEFDPQDGTSTKVTLYKEGPWEVKATVTDEQKTGHPDHPALHLTVKPSMYKIRELFPSGRHYAEDTIPLEVVRLGEDGESVGLPAKAECAWNRLEGLSPTISDPTDSRTEVEFHEEGRGTVGVTVKVSKKPKSVVVGTAKLSLDIKEPRIVMIYKDKRRQSFNRRLAALLLALVGGIAAKRVFGLTFGSFEEYLGAFGWGVGTSVGIDPVAGIVKNVQTRLQALFFPQKGQRQSQQP